MIRLLLIICTVIFAQEADHLLLTRVVTQPDIAESFSIYNPTDDSIELSNYYVCDDEDYYKMQTEGNMSPSSSIGGFTVQFPDISIAPEDTFHIVLNEDYKEFYGDDFVADLVMYGSSDSSLTGSMGFSSNKIDESSELIILFRWDGGSDELIEDVDYFLWGQYHPPINKAGISTYQNDTHSDNQSYYELGSAEYYAYSRIGTDEIGETSSGGNGITGHDETSENFRQSWDIITLFNMGCTDSDAPNFDASAFVDDGSCYTPFSKIISGVYDCGIDSRDACEDGIPSSDAANCQLVNIEGKIVSFGDYSYANGPYALVVEDEQGYRLELTIWPNTWDILSDVNYSILTEPPFFDFVVKTYGNVFTYNGKRQVYVCGPNTIEITQTYNTSGIFIPSANTKTTINPEPFIVIPTLGENLNFTYTFPENSRVIIRIYDLSGRFISSLEDKYFEEAGTVIRNNLELNEYGDEINSSAWDGRDQLGQIVAPGTYIIHIEAMNPVTGETHTAAAPIVVGVKN